MTILIFIAVLVLLIVGHELGHFIVAKAVTMRVLEFGVGFPPKIFGVRFGGETEYTLNWLPLGGFVRIFGENPKDAREPGAFASKHPAAQALVLFAGPFANVLLAFILSALAFTAGAPAVIDDASNGAYVVGEPAVVVGAVLPGSPAEKAGVRAGDAVRALSVGFDVHLIASPDEVSERIAASEGPVTLTLARGGEVRQVTVEATPGLVDDDPERRVIGIATALIGTVAYPLPDAILRAFTATAQSLVFVAVSLATLIGQAFTLSADFSQVAGPVGIASLTGQAAATGLGSLLSFAALLSVNLALINLLPFPALDGGRLLFLAIESVTRRKIPERVAGLFNTLGFALLIALMVAVTVGDVSRLLG